MSIIHWNSLFCSTEMNDNKKSCADCNATRTPLWRTGPAGPRSLCNACGIRYRKRKMTEEEKSSSFTSCYSSSSSYDGDGSRREAMNTKLGFIDDGNQMYFERVESPVKKQRNNGRNLEEVEEAAFLLMCLSCDPVFA